MSKGGGRYVHYCAHQGCKAWGSFGERASDGDLIWWCRTHLPEDYFVHPRPPRRRPQPQPQQGATAVSKDGQLGFL